jgi:sugar/nucleoside kinase (ribokinase family)
MGKSSRGVIAVGRLSVDRDSIAGAAPPPSADGTAFAAAVGAWLVGVDAAVCAAIGPDFPTRLIREITRAGIDTSRVRPAQRADPDPAPEQLASLSPRWSVHICGLSLARQREIVRTISQRVTCFTLDIDPRVTRQPDVSEVLALAAECDAFLPSREAVGHLWPGEPPRAVLRLMASAGVRTAVIKLGVGGSLGMCDGEIISMPAFPVAASGRMGGGDVYSGAFAAVYAADHDLRRAMAWATAAASVVFEANALLGLLSDFARNRVEGRARILDGAVKSSRRMS